MAQGSVAHDGRHIGVAQRLKYGHGAGGEVRDPFDGNDLAGDFGQYGRLIAAAGADFQDAFQAGQLERFSHQRDHIGLTDSLPRTDRHGVVGSYASARNSVGTNRSRGT